MQYQTGLARSLSEAAPVTAPTVALAGAGAGNVDNGTHSYKMTSVHTNGGETAPSPASSVVTVADKTTNGKVAGSAVALGPAGTAKRRIYRTVAGDAGAYKLVLEIGDNTTATFTDNIADADLGADAPSASTFPTARVVLSGGGVTTGNIEAADLFKFAGDASGFYAVSALVSTTEFTLTAKYTGPQALFPLDTDHAYLVARDFTSNVGLPELSPDDVDIRDVYTDAVRRLDSLLQGHTYGAVAGVDELLEASVVGNVPWAARAIASQTGDLSQWRSAANAVLLGVEVGGGLHAPAGMSFQIDSDANTSNAAYTWRKDAKTAAGGTELMGLTEAGAWILPVAGATHAIGGAVDAAIQVYVRGAVAPAAGVARALVVGSSVTAVADANAYLASIDGTLVEAGSGTHALLAGLHLAAPTVTGGAATVTDAATLYVAAAPAGTVAGKNYALWVDAGITRLDGQTFVGPLGANAGNLNGLTIDQGTADDEALTLVSTGDVAHGLSDAITAAYGDFRKIGGADGGLLIHGYREDAGGVAGVLIRAVGNDSTTKTTSGLGALILEAYNHDGTATKATPGADANLMVIRAGTTTRFIFDAEGSGHGDVEWTTFDHHDDLAMLTSLEAEMVRARPAAWAAVTREFSEVLRYSREQLQEAGIVNFYDDDGPRAMVNFTRLAMLHTGAIRQQGQRLATLETRLAALTEGRA